MRGYIKIIWIAISVIVVAIVASGVYLFRVPLASWVLSNADKSASRGGPGNPENQPMSSAHPGERNVLYWYDSMNPAHRSDKPGKAPDGMDLVPMYADTNESKEKMPQGP